MTELAYRPVTVEDDEAIAFLRKNYPKLAAYMIEESPRRADFPVIHRLMKYKSYSEDEMIGKIKEINRVEARILYDADYPVV